MTHVPFISNMTFFSPLPSPPGQGAAASAASDDASAYDDDATANA